MATKEPPLPEGVSKMLYPHQREGLSWLWALHCSATEGILGDNMGLGKTMQVNFYEFNSSSMLMHVNLILLNYYSAIH